jgi:hypothetical protein
MATERQTAANRQNAQNSTALKAPEGGGNILPEILLLQIEPRSYYLTPLIATFNAPKISTEPTEPGINIPHYINNTDTTLNYYKFAKSKIVSHTILTAQASARGPRP